MTYTFNEGGALTSVVSSTGAYSRAYDYDQARRLVSMVETRDGQLFQVMRRSYWPDSVLVERYNADGLRTGRACQRYHFGHLMAVERADVDGDITTYSHYAYDAQWRRVRQIGQALTRITVEWSWEDGLPTKAEFVSHYFRIRYDRTFDEERRLVLDVADWGMDGDPGEWFSYRYDDDGRVVEYMERNRSHVENHVRFEYDSQGRLASRLHGHVQGRDLTTYHYSCSGDS